MATGDELTQSLQADANTHTLTIQGRQVSGNTPEIIASFVTGKAADAVAAARRSAVASADATANLDDAGYTGSLIDRGASLHIGASCRFSVASQSCVIFFALYDEAGGLIGKTRDYTFQADATFKESSSGNFLSELQIVDTLCAPKLFPVLRTAPASGTVSIYIEAL